MSFLGPLIPTNSFPLYNFKGPNTQPLIDKSTHSCCLGDQQPGSLHCLPGSSLAAFEKASRRRQGLFYLMKAGVSAGSRRKFRPQPPSFYILSLTSKVPPGKYDGAGFGRPVSLLQAKTCSFQAWNSSQLHPARPPIVTNIKLGTTFFLLPTMFPALSKEVHMTFGQMMNMALEPTLPSCLSGETGMSISYPVNKQHTVCHGENHSPRQTPAVGST